MRCELILEIRNLHACPGDCVPRKLKVPTDIFSQVDVTTTKAEIDEQLAREEEKARSTEKTRIKIEPCFSFQSNEGAPVFRLGGPYGKLMGLFKEAGGVLYGEKAEGFKTGYKSFLKSIVVKPQWVKLEEVSSIEVNKIPQITAGRSKAMILQYYEIIPRCKARLNIQIPDGEREKFIKILAQSEGLPFGPKRRGEIKVLETIFKAMG